MCRGRRKPSEGRDERGGKGKRGSSSAANASDCSVAIDRRATSSFRRGRLSWIHPREADQT
jgi:hypothetical protein